MFFFPVYAVVFWLLIYRGRRSWRGLCSLLASVLGLVGIAWLHWKLSIWTDGRIYLPILQLLMYPYIALVALGGTFVVLLPRHHAPGQCHACGYGLEGLETTNTGITCPECGKGPKHAATPAPPITPPAPEPAFVAQH